MKEQKWQTEQETEVLKLKKQ